MKYVIALMIVLFAITGVQAETSSYKLYYSAAITSTGDGSAPSVCKAYSMGSWVDTNCGLATHGAKNVQAQLDTTDTDNTSTSVDLNFIFGSDTESYECITALGDNKKKSCLISEPTNSISFNIDCNATNCDPIIWVEIER